MNGTGGGGADGADARVGGANLSIAARRNHEWYLRHMPDYPKGRWAMIPGIL